MSNREPYIHVHRGESIDVRRPASGLVTALEPIMRACSGTWIAHGSGSADRDVVDRHDRVAVPPESPAYQLRRVWLTPEEEAGYYYGFANEGLWPLCHIAHVRPTFRTSDWEQYVKVNRRSRAPSSRSRSRPTRSSSSRTTTSRLLPRMIREALPAATIITFWHIPWPNPEAFAICPWREELLDGLLGSSILGFHTQFHCNNFVDTVDRLLEARVDREMFTVSYRGKLTAVKRYPISIEWPPSPALVRQPGRPTAAPHVRERHDLPPDHAIGVGVDRLDYTKGIEERLPRRGAPARAAAASGSASSRSSRSPLRRAAASSSTRSTKRACGRWRRGSTTGSPAPAHPPLVLKVEHHEPDAIYEYYRAAELCLVSSLHDGMNLVAKEFVAARDDERGVLILSQFTGAARELPEAIIVNPYDTDQCADGAARRADDAGGGAARPHAADARADPGVQRLSLGGTHADRRRGHAPARPAARTSDGAEWCAAHRRGSGGWRPMTRLRSRTRPGGRFRDDPASGAAAGLGLLLRHRRHPRRHRRLAGRRATRSATSGRSSSGLHGAAGGAVALISGRSIADIDRLFPGMRLPAAGQHGIERRDAAGRRVAPRVSRPAARWPGARRLAAAVARHPGLLLEDKGLSLALHYRRAPRLAGFAHRLMRSVADPHRARTSACRPASGWSR